MMMPCVCQAPFAPCGKVSIWKFIYRKIDNPTLHSSPQLIINVQF